MRADYRRVAAACGLITVLMSGCRFPEECDIYPGAHDAVTSAMSTPAPCELRLSFGGRTYILRTDALVTDVGEQVSGIEVCECHDTQTSSQDDQNDLAIVRAFRLGAYCTSDAIAVELEPGEQLMVFEAKDERASLLRSTDQVTTPTPP